MYCAYSKINNRTGEKKEIQKIYKYFFFEVCGREKKGGEVHSETSGT